MTSSTVHSLFSLMVTGLILGATGLPCPSWGLFLSPIVSILPDLDHSFGPPGRTPFGHSFPFTLIWNIIGLSVIWMLVGPHPPFHLPGGEISSLVLGLTVGLWSHVLLDIGSGGVYYLWPTSPHPRRFCSPYPVGIDFPRTRGGTIALLAGGGVLDRLMTGWILWAYWRRVVLPG